MPKEVTAWSSFARELRVAMAAGPAEKPVTAPELAMRLELRGRGPVNAEKVNAWRNGRSRPPLDWLPDIATELGMGGEAEQSPAAYLLSRMGLLKTSTVEEAHELAWRVQKLELKLMDSIERTADHGRRQGLQGIVSAAGESGRWEVAVRAAYEGPDGYKMHVADRIDLRRLHGEPTTAQQAFEDEALRESLRSAYAVPSTAYPRWTTREESSQVARFSIAHIGSPTAPLRTAPHPHVPSVLCYSLTVRSWVNDTAGLVARALGYGQSTTRDMAMELTGIPRGNTTPTARSRAHAFFLQNPPRRRVWSHHAIPDDHAPDPFAVANADVHVVLIREPEEDLRLHATQPNAPSYDRLVRAQEQVDELVRTQYADRVQVLDAANLQEDRDARTTQAMAFAREVFVALEGAGRLASNVRSDWERIKRMDSRIARPFLSWLESQLEV